MKKHLAILWSGIALLFALQGCVQSGPSAETAARVGDEYLQAIQQGDEGKIFGYYAADFFKVKPKEEWQSYLHEVHDKLGNLKGFKLVAKNKDTRFSGIFYILQYRTTYAKGTARETIILEEPLDTNQLKIFGHKIDSKALRG